MEIYQSYAAVYDAIGQGRLGAQLAAWALEWLAARGGTPARVLDLACGTGEAARVFARAGCAVVGVDRSRPMLEIARGRSRDEQLAISFAEGDIRALAAAPGAGFDLATCFYDSLNYLTADGDLERVFGGVAAALRPGGWWIFDLNTEAVFLDYHQRDMVTYDGPGMLVYNQLAYDQAARLGTGRIVWFAREIDRWWRGEETHVERVWADAEVRAALDAAGLALVARLAPGGEPASEQAYRVVYVAQRQISPVPPW
ncbi:class I SAM-dependent DNA methyltransferase [Kouleothrix sp.]|uniref:class I SAM-dependent DNA methyltransferase n=1 Tax=Kouleothrix sp. TaxID=2779161 RepID=UPI00391A8F37